MELNNNDAAVCTDSINAQAGTTSAGEMDLYDELIAFVDLSPEEQLRFADQSSEETEKGSAEQLRSVGRTEKASAETEKTSAEQAEEQAFREPLLTTSPMESVEEAAIEPAAESASGAEDSELYVASSLARPEMFESARPIQRVEAEATVPAAVAASDVDVSTAYFEPGEVRPRVVEGPRPSGPLSGFSLPPNIVYTGAPSRKACLACGAESDADDLFCISCGVFTDEIVSTLSVIPTCPECEQRIAADEIFCPWCGSALPA